MLANRWSVLFDCDQCVLHHALDKVLVLGAEIRSSNADSFYASDFAFVVHSAHLKAIRTLPRSACTLLRATERTHHGTRHA